jgi:membrane protein DedA with SNARE-associated domain
MTGHLTNIRSFIPILRTTLSRMAFAGSLYKLDAETVRGCTQFGRTAWLALALLRAFLLGTDWQAPLWHLFHRMRLMHLLLEICDCFRVLICLVAS